MLHRRKDSNYYNTFGLERDDHVANLCQDKIVFEKLGKVLIMGDFNVRVGKYENMEISEENIVDPCVLRDSKDCIVTNYGRIRIHILDCLKWYKCFSFDKCTHMFTNLMWRKCSRLRIFEDM